MSDKPKKKSPNNNIAWNSLNKLWFKYKLFTQENKSIDMTKHSFCIGIDKYVVDGRYSSRSGGMKQIALEIISIQRYLHVHIANFGELWNQ